MVLGFLPGMKAEEQKLKPECWSPKPVLSALRGVWRCCGVYVDVEALGGGDFRGHAISVGVVVGAVGGSGGARRLRVLPDLGEGDAAFGGAGRLRGRICRKRTSGGGWARIVDGPVDDVASGGVDTNIFRSHDVVVVRGGNAGAVDAGAESGGGDAIDPGVDVGLLFREHASTLLLVEEDNGLRGETFAARGGGGGLRVGLAEARGFRDGFQFGVEASVEEHEESEAGGFDDVAMAGPGIGLFAGRMVEPVAGVGERFVQGFEVCVAGVDVAVEAKVGRGFSRLRSDRDNESCNAKHKDQTPLHFDSPRGMLAASYRFGNQKPT